jgi:hypothetical protein
MDNYTVNDRSLLSNFHRLSSIYLEIMPILIQQVSARLR